MKLLVHKPRTMNIPANVRPEPNLQFVGAGHLVNCEREAQREELRGNFA